MPLRTLISNLVARARPSRSPQPAAGAPLPATATGPLPDNVIPLRARREFERAAVREGGWISIGGEYEPAQLFDISAGGALCATKLQVPVGATVSVVLELDAAGVEALGNDVVSFELEAIGHESSFTVDLVRLRHLAPLGDLQQRYLAFALARSPVRVKPLPGERWAA